MYYLCEINGEKDCRFCLFDIWFSESLFLHATFVTTLLTNIVTNKFWIVFQFQSATSKHSTKQPSRTVPSVQCRQHCKRKSCQLVCVRVCSLAQTSRSCVLNAADGEPRVCDVCICVRVCVILTVLCGVCMSTATRRRNS